MESDLLESSVESRSDPTVLRPGGRRVAIRDSMISVTLAVRFAAESEPYRDSVHRQPPAEAGPGGQQAPAFNSDSEPNGPNPPASPTDYDVDSDSVRVRVSVTWESQTLNHWWHFKFESESITIVP